MNKQKLLGLSKIILGISMLIFTFVAMFGATLLVSYQFFGYKVMIIIIWIAIGLVIAAIGGIIKGKIDKSRGTKK